MKALITGATGLVGRHLTEYLLSENIPVVALGRDIRILSTLEQKGAEILEFDLTAGSEEYERLNPYSSFTWFHIAAAISGASKELLDAVNIEGTKKIVEKAEALAIPHLILVSSISTYSIDLVGKISENAEQNPESYYGQTKLAQEHIVTKSDLRYSIVRPPYIGGPYDQNFLEEYASRIEQNKMPTFSRDGKISYVDARDLAQALYLTASHNQGKSESYNVVSEVISHSDLVALLGKKMGYSPPHGRKYPYWLAMIAGVAGEAKSKIQGKSSERSISRYRIRTLCRQFELDPTKIGEELGYKPQYGISSSIDDWLQARN